MIKWYQVPREEQETIINIDYYDTTINVYTTRQNVATRLARRFGTPTKTYTTDGLVSGVEYKISFFDKKLRYLFSKTMLVGGFVNPKE